jgi:hypothetical protein
MMESGNIVSAGALIEDDKMVGSSLFVDFATDEELYTIISEHAHTDFDKVWADSDRDYWMTAVEAKEYGMIDEVLSRKPSKE